MSYSYLANNWTTINYWILIRTVGIIHITNLNPHLESANSKLMLTNIFIRTSWLLIIVEDLNLLASREYILQYVDVRRNLIITSQWQNACNWKFYSERWRIQHQIHGCIHKQILSTFQLVTYRIIFSGWNIWNIPKWFICNNNLLLGIITHYGIFVFLQTTSISTL